nr:MAG TPA: hypothetical protein [Caudoviricetes sp.]
MGNPYHLLSLLPPEVREAVQAEIDRKAVADLFGLTKEEPEMTAETKKLSTADFKQVSDLLAETELKPKMTVEAARDIWQAVCSGIGSITAAQFRRSSGEYAKELKYVLEFLRKELGQDESVLLGSFLSSGELSVKGKDGSGELINNSDLPEIQKFAIEKGMELNRSVYMLSCCGKAWLKTVGRSGLEAQINAVQMLLDSIFDRIRANADDLGFPQANRESKLSTKTDRQWGL